MTVVFVNDVPYSYPYVHAIRMAQNKRSTPDDDASEDASSIVIKMENENWRGKNDPTERRRIQNRLNQRAFRQRRRTGTSPPQSKATPATSPGGVPSSSAAADMASIADFLPPDQSQDERSLSATARQSPTAPGKSRSSPPGKRPTATWDELARTINGNLMEAVASNARALHFDEAAVRGGEHLRTPNLRTYAPTALDPVALQYQIPHDLLYDTIPHPRLRQNIMAGIVSGKLDQTALSECIRASGVLVNWNGTLQRRGLVVWGDASCIQSWELAEGFVRSFGFLLEGCGDFLIATNAWRAMRGEAPIVL